MFTKEYGQTNTFMSIILSTKITLDMWMGGPFHNRSGVIISWENVWTNSYVQSLVTKQSFLSENKTQSKRKGPKFLIALGDFLYKVWMVYSTAFQSLFSELIRVWELFFSVGWKLLFLQTFIPTIKNRSST